MTYDSIRESTLRYQQSWLEKFHGCKLNFGDHDPTDCDLFQPSDFIPMLDHWYERIEIRPDTGEIEIHRSEHWPSPATATAVQGAYPEWVQGV